MSDLPPNVARFLDCDSIAVAGVSRDSGQPANAIFRRLRDSGHRVFAVNPKADEVEGVPCHADLSAIPDSVQAVVVATPPGVAAEVVREAADLGVSHVWFHRSFGEGSVSEAAVRACEERGIESIVGGCPLMFCEPVDVAHRCMRWWLGRRGRVPR